MTGMERWLAPGILVVVAGVQLSLANFRDLSPWKGGGFGMFASVDAPSMRVVWCEGVTEDGKKVLVDALDAVGPDRRSNMRAMPGERGLAALGEMLLPMVFVPMSVQDDAVVERLLAENPDLGWTFDPVDRERRGFYRAIRPGDPDLGEEETVSLRGVRLRWWRVEFDYEGKRMVTAPMGEVVEVGEWGIAVSG
jgi:hypothetical protein